MSDTSGRLVRLVSLLQKGGGESGPDLARRLDVSTRTVRKDVERLRALGYVVDATPGTSGGYRLRGGRTVPPLVLDDQEALAVANSLRMVAAQASLGALAETSLRALVKVHQVLPPDLWRQPGNRAATLSTRSLRPAPPGRTVDGYVLLMLAIACRDRQRVIFQYASTERARERRDAEPYRLVNVSQGWFLVGWERREKEWKAFEVARVTRPRQYLAPRMKSPPPLPPDGGAALVRAAALEIAALEITDPGTTAPERLDQRAREATVVDDG